MLDFFRQWIGGMVSLALFIVLAEMMLPKGKMRKYAGFATGALLVFAVVKPMTGLIGGEFDLAAVQSADAGALEKLQVEKSSKLLEEEQMSQIVKLYRSEITDRIEQDAEEVDGVAEASADVIIDEDYNSAAFGEIKRIYLEIKTGSISDEDGKISGNNVRNGTDEKGPDSGDYIKDKENKNENENENENENNRDRIEKVIIYPIKNTYEKEAPGTGEGPAALEQKLKDRMNRVFGVDMENIIITFG